MKDPESEARRHFHGIDYFPVNEAYRVTAKWVADAAQDPDPQCHGADGETRIRICEFHLHGKRVQAAPDSRSRAPRNCSTSSGT